ncbi:MAG: hypothetical protein WKF62_07455 [Solirubrobacterales bacterium]
MTESEFLVRFDAHIVRMDVAIGRIEEELRLSREMHADVRSFTRDLTGRNEIVLGEMAANLSDLGEQTRAHTAAVLNVLDRLN